MLKRTKRRIKEFTFFLTLIALVVQTGISGVPLTTSGEIQVTDPRVTDSTPEVVLQLDELAQNYYICIRMAAGHKSTLMYNNQADCLRDALSKYQRLRHRLNNPFLNQLEKLAPL